MSIIKIPEIVISVLFLVTGIVMLLMNGQITPLKTLKLFAVVAAIPTAIIGFKKSNTTLIVSSFLLLIVSYGLAEMNKYHIRKVEISPEIIENPEHPAYNMALHGAALFDAYCANCHGTDGKSLNGVIELSLSKTDTPNWHQAIVEGKSGMPSYKEVMKEAEIQAVIIHVQTLMKN